MTTPATPPRPARTSGLARLFGSTPAQRRLRAALLAFAVVAVPLAVAGVVAGAIGGADDRLDAIPAIVVNDDEMVTITNADGTEQPVLAGRLLVTELTGGGETGFDWSISNDEEAAQKLADGEVYAVLTIPSDFSASVTSLSGADPTVAQLDIRTDDSHGYLAGTVADSVGQAMSTAFGREIAQTYLAGLYGGIAQMAGALADAADGAGSLADGADSLAGGLGQLSDGMASYAAGVGELSSGVGASAAGAREAANGASDYADGVAQYTTGVEGLASGLGQLNAGAAGLDGISDGWDQYVGGITAGVDQIETNVGPVADRLDAFIADPANADVIAQYPQIVEAAGAIDATLGQLDQLSTGGQTLAAATRSGIDGIQGGISDAAGGAAQLSAGSASIRDGGYGLASGIGDLATGLEQLAGGAAATADGANELSAGVAGSADGASQLAGGADALASGLAKGADAAAPLGEIDADATAAVVAQPVTSTATRDNEIGSIGEVIAMLFAPIGLWLGAMALFLVYRPFRRDVLGSTASTGGIVGRSLTRAGIIALAQVVGVVALMHTALGVDVSLLPQTIAYATLLALAFTAVHAFLSAWLGRAGTIVSLVLLVVQLVATGGLIPIEVLSAPFQAISVFLPLSWAVQGMQAIIAGVGGAAVAGPAAVIALFGVGGVLGTAVVVGRRRGIRSTGFASAAVA
jgi:putative membrane protein